MSDELIGCRRYRSFAYGSTAIGPISGQAIRGIFGSRHVPVGMALQGASSPIS